ncbi:MAG: deoxyribodipyrimidine photolyase, partial [Deltaproteobacteria bacterium]|nr:deoxyribodipyrimidine photolyase [Deltaproteobacteria bacterium]
GVGFVLLNHDPPSGAIKLCKNACVLITDRGYLKHQRLWRDRISRETDLPIIEVEGDVVFSVEFISSKLMFYARTFRPKVQKMLPHFLEDLPSIEPKVSFASEIAHDWVENSVDDYLDRLSLDKSVSTVNYYIGGEDEAGKRLEIFVRKRLPFYSGNRSDPGMRVTSELSPYLRFGQISPVQILKKNPKRPPLKR